MPDPTEYNDEKEWMSACVPARIAEGDEQEQAVAVCMSMWGDKKSIKSGSRHNLSDRGRIRQIRSLTLELEPNDVDIVAEEQESEVVLIPDVKSITLETQDTTPAEIIGSIKALDDWTLDVLGMPYGGHINGKDELGDYFSPNTNTYIAKDRIPLVTYYHGFDPDGVPQGEPEIIGTVKGYEQKEDGWHFQVLLDKASEYARRTWESAKKGLARASSGAMWNLIRRASDGELLHWPISELAIWDATTNRRPANQFAVALPAMKALYSKADLDIEKDLVIPLKSMSASLPSITDNLKAAVEAVGDTARSEGEAEETIPPIKKTLEGIHMEITEEKLAELVGSAVSQGVEQALKSLPAVTPDVGVKVTKDEADQEWAHPGEFFKAVKTAAYYPMAEDPRLRPLKATGMSEGIPADGGYLIPEATAAGIVDHMLAEGSILSRISMDNVSGNSMVYNGIDESTHVGSLYGGLIGYWLGEGGTKTASKPKFYQVSLKLKKIAALCYATDEQLEDTPNLQSWLMRTVPSVLRWYVESAIISGDGNGKPLGITQSPCLVSQVREDANEVNPSDFATMWSRRWLGASDYVWLVNPTVAAQMNQFAVGTLPVYMPANNITGKPYATVYGQPVIESEHVATWKSAGDILLCALSQYQAIGKGGVQAASSIHVAFTTDETAFRFVYRIDGSPLWNSAVTPENGSTFSPFVSLAAASS